MRLADCLVELVCHSRWLASMCLSRLSDSANESYADDVEAARSMLNSLSRSMSHIETLSEVPVECIDALCSGVLYLLVGEIVCGSCPPTMHQFLSQTTLQRQQSTVQSQLLMVRWFSSVGIISIDELLEVIVGAGTTVASYKSDYDSHMAVARHLADPDPFYLGAHIIVLRGILLRYCSDLISVEDIMGHVALVAPDEQAEPHTIEDSLLHWVRTLVKMLDESTTKALAVEIDHVDDLYLHTNDGRMIALVVHHYRPDVVPLQSVHLMNPLTVWQRQDNWSAVTRAAESLGLWVGIFADEMVAHGFSTLQLHVLRVIEELFAVLAVGAERSYVEMSTELDGTTTFINVNRSIGKRASFVASSTASALPKHSIENANFTQVTPGKESDQLNDGHDVHELSRQDPALCEEEEEDDDNREITEADLAELHGAEYNVVMTGMFLQGISAPIHREETATQDKAAMDAVPVTVQPTHVADSVSNPPSVIANSEHLQPPSSQDTSSVHPVGNDTDTSFQVHHQPPHNPHHVRMSAEEIQRSSVGASMVSHVSSTQQQASIHEAEDAVNIVSPTSGADVGVQESLMPSVVASTADTEIDAATRLFTTMSSINASQTVVEEPPRVTDSPEITRSAEGPVIGRSRSLRQKKTTGNMNQVMTSVAHFEQFRKQGNTSAIGGGGGGVGGGNVRDRVGGSVVQGSVDAVGIEQLLSELGQLSEMPPPVVNAPSAVKGGVSPPPQTPADLREQNIQLRWALEEQQRKIGSMVVQLRKGLRKHEFNTIMRHLRVHKPQHPAALAGASPHGVAGAPSNVLSPDPTVLGAASPAGDATLRRSFAGKSDRVAEAVLKASIASNTRSSLTASQVLPVGPIGKQDQVGVAPSPVQQQPSPVPMAEPIMEESPIPQDPAVQQHPIQVAAPPPPAPSPSTAEGGKGGTAFDVSIGTLNRHRQQPSSAPVDPAGPPKVPKLSIPQLQKLKERHDKRKQEATQGQLFATKANPALPALGKRNNRTVITNALKFVCLTGPVNKTQLENALKVMGDIKDPNAQFLVLLKDEFTHVFRGLYVTLGDGTATRIYGAGPQSVIVGAEGQEPPPHAAFMKFFKFNTGTKKFEGLPSKLMNQMTDALAIAGKLGKIQVHQPVPQIEL